MNVLDDNEKLHKMFCECLFSKTYIEQLNSYELEKIWVYADDYCKNLEPNFNKRINHLLETGQYLKPDEIESNVTELMNTISNKIWPKNDTSIILRNNQKTTYQWQSDKVDDDLTKLFNKMVGVCIAKNTTLEQFKAVFTAKPIDSIANKIEWLLANNLLAYFIDLLEQKKLIKKIINNDIWAIAKVCFTKSENLSQSKELYKNNTNGKPRNSKIIEQLF